MCTWLYESISMNMHVLHTGMEILLRLMTTVKTCVRCIVLCFIAMPLISNSVEGE